MSSTTRNRRISPFNFMQLQSYWESASIPDDRPVHFSEDAWRGFDSNSAAILVFSLMKCLEYEVSWTALRDRNLDDMKAMLILIVDSVAYEVFKAHKTMPSDRGNNAAGFEARARFVTTLLQSPPAVGSEFGYRPLLSGDYYSKGITFAFTAPMKDRSISCVSRTLHHMNYCTTFPGKYYSLSEAFRDGFVLNPRYQRGGGAHVAMGLNFKVDDRCNHMSSASFDDLDTLTYAITGIMLDESFAAKQASPYMSIVVPNYLQASLFVGTSLNMSSGLPTTIRYYNSCAVHAGSDASVSNTAGLRSLVSYADGTDRALTVTTSARSFEDAKLCTPIVMDSVNSSRGLSRDLLLSLGVNSLFIQAPCLASWFCSIARNDMLRACGGCARCPSGGRGNAFTRGIAVNRRQHFILYWLTYFGFEFFRSSHLHEMQCLFI